MRSRGRLQRIVNAHHGLLGPGDRGGLHLAIGLRGELADRGGAGGGRGLVHHAVLEDGGLTGARITDMDQLVVALFVVFNLSVMVSTG